MTESTSTRWTPELIEAESVEAALEVAATDMAAYRRVLIVTHGDYAAGVLFAQLLQVPAPMALGSSVRVVRGGGAQGIEYSGPLGGGVVHVIGHRNGDALRGRSADTVVLVGRDAGPEWAAVEQHAALVLLTALAPKLVTLSGALSVHRG
jgi:hypothetical protein